MRIYSLILPIIMILSVFVILEVQALELTIPIPEGDHNPGLRTAIDWYVPRNHAINVGDRVTWVNEDFIPHTVTSGEGISLSKNLKEAQGTPDGLFDSGIMNSQESWSYTFTETGEYTYFCTLHPWVERSITVFGSEASISSPKKQMSQGVEAFNVQCKPDFSLVFKATDLSPACVKTQNTQKLIDLGWALSYDPFPMKVQGIEESKVGVYVTLQGEDKVAEILSKTQWNAGSKMTYLDTSTDGSLLLASSSNGNKIHAFDLNSGEFIAEIKVGSVPKGVKIHQVEKLAFVANENSGTVSVIDLSNLSVIKEIKVGEIPHNIVFHPDGLKAYVTIQGGDEVAIIDIRSLEKTGSIPVGVLPHNLDISPDGRTLFVTNIGTNDVAVIDLRDGEVIKKIPISNGHHGIDVPPFGDRIFVSGIGSNLVNVIDATSLELIKQINVGEGPHGLKTDSTGTKLYVGVTQTNQIVIIDTQNLGIIDRIDSGVAPFWVAVPGNP